MINLISKTFCFKSLDFGYSNLHRISSLEFRASLLSFAISLSLILIPHTSFAASTGKFVKEGNALYKEEKFDEALDKYSEALKKDPNSDVINFDFGTALYKKNNYKESIDHFQKSLLTDDEKLKEKAHYNLGNAFYKSGIENEEKDLNAAVNFLKESLGEYEKTLVLNKNNEDAIFNHEFVKKELERIEKKQQQQNQEKSQDKKENSDKSNQQKNQPDQDKQQGQEKQNQEKDNQAEEQKADQKKETGQSEASNKDEPKKEQEMNEASAQEMSKEEAESLLNSYKQNEEPQELLNFLGQKSSEQPVLKDW
jgi:Ca-activated chloride channel family protein|tara:strand:- start:4657 stop:5586 length:930 start_codon:yes stop_codon:yes gene_type:complete